MDGRDIHFQIPFQFQTGAIKSSCRPAAAGGFRRGFNSKLVRLKGAAAGEASAAGRGRFQFQTGAIKSTHARLANIAKLGFNSKLVRLKECRWVHASVLFPGFNSKLVRLKVDQPVIRRWIGSKFQFQTGAIKSEGARRASADKKEFQFQTGAIKSLWFSLVEKTQSFVSIPNWCD